MLSFLVLVFALTCYGSIFQWVYGFMILACLAPLHREENEKGSFTVVEQAYMVGVMVLSYYVLGFWAAFAASLSHKMLNGFSGIGAWFSWLVAWCIVAGTFYVGRVEKSSAATCIGLLIVKFGFIVFAVWPSLMEFPYGWALSLFPRWMVWR